MAERPTIVCLCGSMRFYREFITANQRETLDGKIVLSVGCPGPEGCEGHSDEEKIRLDELHLRKIDLADEVLVISKSMYVGESTQRELRYAKQQGKRIRWAEIEAAEQAAAPEPEATP
jgi:hypothetical protein